VTTAVSGEEQSLLSVDAADAGGRGDDGDGREPGDEPDREDAGGPAAGGPVVVQGVVGDEWGGCVLAVVAAPAGRDELGSPMVQCPAGECGGGDDDGERHTERGERDERGDGEADEDRVAEGTIANPPYSLGDDGHDGGGQAGEQGGDHACIAVADVDGG